MKGKTISEIKLGDSAFFEKTLTQTDAYLFAGITGDLNPAHVNAVKSEKGMFKKQVVHGVLTAGLISTVLGMYLPGPGTIYLAQELRFTAPVYFGDTIKATAEVIEIIPEKNRIKLKTTCTNQDGKEVITGVATCMPPR